MFHVKTILGWRKYDPFPDHPSGHALDFMIDSKAQGQAIADYLHDNSAALGVKYIIWNRQVWQASGKPVAGWHPYTSTNNPHTDHVHVTFLDQPGTGQFTTVDNPVTPGGSTSPSTDPECAWGFHVPVAGDTCLLSKVQVRTLLGMVCVGGGLVVGLAGVAFIVVVGLKKTGLTNLIPAGKVVSRLA